MNSMFRSFRRGLPRIIVLFVIGMMFYWPAVVTPQLLGPTAAPLFFSFSLTFFGLAVGDAALRLLQPRIDSQMAADAAIRERNVAGGLVYLGRCILAAVIMTLVVGAGRG